MSDPVSVRAIRGAIQVDADTREDVLEGSAELVTAVLERNRLSADDIISILFTATPDLTAEFPAYAARLLGLTDVPLMCASEIAVPGSMPRVCGCSRTWRPTSAGPTCGTCTCGRRGPAHRPTPLTAEGAEAVSFHAATVTASARSAGPANVAPELPVALSPCVAKKNWSPV